MSIKHQVQPTPLPVTSDGLRRLQLAIEAQVVAAGAAGVTTLNSRSGAVSLTSNDVILALGYTPAAQGTPPPVTTSAAAGEALGGQRAVYVSNAGQALYSDKNLDICRRTIGLTTGAAASGATATIQTEGVMIEASWAWTGDEPVWLGATGLLTQTVPTTGYLFQVGIPIGPTKLRIEPQLVAKL